LFQATKTFLHRLLTAKIKNIYYESNRVYGARKIREELRKDGLWVSRKRIRRLMDAAGLVPISWRKSVQTTVSDPKASPFPNLLKQDFKVALPNQTWVSDFTYVPDRRRLAVPVHLCRPVQPSHGRLGGQQH